METKPDRMKLRTMRCATLALLMFVAVASLISEEIPSRRTKSRPSKKTGFSGENGSATLIFVGDISFNGPIKYFAQIEKSCDYKKPFEKVKGFLSGADLRIANLESPLLENAYNEKPYFPGKTFYHFGSTKAVDGLKYAGFNIMQLANNHINDFGTRGANSSLKALRSVGIEYVGIQSNKEKAQRPLIKNVNGVRIGFLSYCLNGEGCKSYSLENEDNLGKNNIFKMHAAVYNKKQVTEDIRALNKRVNIVVVLMHWSTEGSPFPPLGIRRIARELVVLGAKLVIGNHPHIVQGHHCQKGGLVAYSLGNFMFLSHNRKARPFNEGKKPTKKMVKEYLDSMQDIFSLSKIGLILKVTVDKKSILHAEYLPLELEIDPISKCLQHRLLARKWQPFCGGSEDSYCIDYRDLCATSAEDLETSPRPKNRACIKHQE